MLTSTLGPVIVSVAGMSASVVPDEAHLALARSVIAASSSAAA